MDSQTYTDVINTVANRGITPSVPLEESKFELTNNSYIQFFNVAGGSDSNESSLVTLIEPYLYYMDSYFKNVDGGYTHVMFVPDGEKNVTVFQRKYDINIDYYLRDVSVFYYRKSVDWLIEYGAVQGIVRTKRKTDMLQSCCMVF